MTATITEISTEAFPCSLKSGTGKKRVMIFFRSTAASAGSAVNFATYVPGLADIEGIVYETDGGAVEGTASTWSSTTFTVSSGAGTNYEGCIMGTY